MKRALSSLAFLLLLAAPAGATFRTWTGAVNNLWSTHGNWDPAGQPASDDVLQFPSSAPGPPLIVTVNDLDPATVFAYVDLGNSYSVQGLVRVTGGAFGTFEDEVQILGDATIGGDFDTVNIQGRDVLFQSGTIATLLGYGNLNCSDHPTTLSAAGSYSGEVNDGFNMFTGAEITLAHASLPSATFLIGRGITGEGSIGHLIAYGWVAPGTHTTAGTITTGELELTSFPGMPEMVGEYYVDLAPAGNDVLFVNGTVSIENKPLTVSLGGFAPPLGSSYTIIDNDGSDAVTGQFSRRAAETDPGTPLPEGATFTVDGHVFRITYRGGTGNDVVLMAVPPTAPTTTSLNLDPSASLAGQKVTLTATITSPYGTPEGTVSFFREDQLLGSAALSGGTASITRVFATGSHSLTAHYEGTGFFEPSDSPPVVLPVTTLGLSIRDAESIEGNPGEARTVDVPVTLSAASPDTITVEYATSDDSAHAGTDYDFASGALVFAPGQTQRTITITLLGDDAAEGDESFWVTLSNAGAAEITRASGNVIIRNDDLPYILHRDLAYTSHGTRLDLRVPRESTSPAPVIVVIDADDWSASKRQSDFGERQAARGFAVATIDFRSPIVAPFPAQIDDVRAAIQWVRDHAAEYNLDPLSISVWGRGLAGGHLAALAGTSVHVPGARVQGVVAAQAATDLLTLQAQSCVSATRLITLLGCEPSACPVTARAASPVAHVTSDDPPFVILHGEGDCNAPRAQSESFVAALRAVNVGVSLVNLPRAGGAYDWSHPLVQAELDEFLERIMRSKNRRQRAVRK